jgi:glucokinase
MAKWVIGVDLGGTQVRAIRTGAQGTPEARASQLTQASEGSEAVLERIFTCIEEVLQGVPPEQVIGIGIGAPGPIDADGRLHDPPNLPGWKEFSLAERISTRFELPTFAGNDANLAALGERRFGAGRGLDDLIYVTVSTGIGGGIISGGKLVLGAHGFAAEIGHQTIVAEGPICGCGQPGHLEALASGPAIARQARERIAAGAQTMLADYGEQIKTRDVTEAASLGDSVAIELLAKAGYYIGLGLVNLIHVLEPQRILIGGGVSQAGNLLFDPIRETIRDHLMSSVYESVEIQPAALKGDVGLLGAVALVLELAGGSDG